MAPLLTETAPPATLEVAVHDDQPDPPDCAEYDDPGMPAKDSVSKDAAVDGVNTEPARFAGAAAHVEWRAYAVMAASAVATTDAAAASMLMRAVCFM
jgi:hypothetical protein